MTLLQVLRTAFGTRGPLDRRTYLVAGAALTIAKYAIDTTVIYLATGRLWLPTDYLSPLVTLSSGIVAGLPTVLTVGLLLWSLPFLWIGVALTVRRSIDAGLPPWIAVAFFLPVLNYILILGLLAAPGVRAGGGAARLTSREEAELPDTDLFDANGALAVAAGALSVICTMVTGIVWLRSYGLTTFLGTPFLMGLVVGAVANRGRARPTGQTMILVGFGLAVAAVSLLLVAFEGIVCLVMALPLAAPLALLGALVGRSLAIARTPAAGMAMLLVIMPAGSLLDRTVDTDAVRVVTTSVDVHAAPSRVWQRVVSFPDITERPGWPFRLGLAYPLRARIEGTGVGAIRNCEFTTGSFREPITAWQEPSRLAFDVTDQPAPLREWSPYSQVYAPHLEGFFRTTHGEFRLVPLPDGGTRLEGRTWYVLRMAPAAYWTPITDAILHRIHRRVLRHIAILAEQH
jgi:uncharacterized membrane protein YhaH (DUF805 family)